MASDSAGPARPAGGFLQPGGLHEYLIFQLHGLTRAATAGIDLRLRRELGISRRDWRALAFLAPHDGITATAFAQAAGLDKVIASRLAASLVERGLVRRRRDGRDRRIALLMLSERGRELYEAARAVTADYNVELAQVLDAEEAEQLRVMLARLAARAEAQRAGERARSGGAPLERQDALAGARHGV